jgi:putative peptidoglycan lipid II flippase
MIATQTIGVLNACGRFGVPAMASTFFNIGSVTAGPLLRFTIGCQFGQTLIVPDGVRRA